jgi:hypothetical protein
MCFKNLPIEFDASGKATLKEGMGDPYAVAPAKPKGYVRRQEGPGAQLAAPPRLRDWNIDPMTRVAGALAVHCVLDLENRVAVEAHSRAMLFRGYELILQGRDPRDAIDISSRACGVCGGVHATVSSQCLDMAFGAAPPPLGTEVRNLGEVGEMFYDRPLHLGLLAGPDYSTALVSVTNPELVTRAERTLSPHGDVHGYRTIKDIMDALNPLTGQIYLEALEWTRVGRIMCMLMYGKYPHPSTLAPGGVTTTISTSSFNEYYTQLGKIFDFAKVICRIWDDLIDFFLEANPAYEQVGQREMNLAQTGIWDNSEYYDATFQNIDTWGNQRWSKPCIIIEGKQVTTNITQINMGFEEFIDHSFYEDWTRSGGPRFRTDPLGNPISPYHPWNKTTIPKPTATDFRGKYTWDTAPPLGPAHHRDGRLRPAVVDGPGQQQRGQPLLRVDRRRPAHGHAPPRPPGGGAVLEGAPGHQRRRAQPGPGVLHGLHRRHRHELHAEGPRVLAAGRDQGPHAVQGAQGRAHRHGVLGGRPRLAGPPHAHGQGQDRQLPDHHPVDAQRLAPRPVRRPRPLRAGHHRHPAPRERARRAGQGPRRPAGHPQLRPLHAVHHAHGHRPGDHHP